MRVLIVKLSSLGDVVHAMPVVHDIRRAHPDAAIDWVVEPAFAPMVGRVDGIARVIPCPLRRFRKQWWKPAMRAEWMDFREAIAAYPYDAILDVQGLTKSAVIARMARGVRFGLGNRTDGSAWERPARWLVDHPVAVAPRIHVVERSRVLAARALDHGHEGAPVFGLKALPCAATRVGPVVAFVHGTTRADKEWPEADWIALARRFAAEGWQVALPRSGARETLRAERIAHAVGEACTVWPELPLDRLIDRLATTDGVIGVDSGLSHVAVALDLPHVQVYTLPTSWRTGPLASSRQRAIEGRPSPAVAAVWDAWRDTGALAEVRRVA